MMYWNGFTNILSAVLTNPIVSFGGGVTLSYPVSPSISIITTEVVPMIFAFVPFVSTSGVTKFSFSLICKPVRYFKLFTTLLTNNFSIWFKANSKIMSLLKSIRRRFSFPMFIPKLRFIRTNNAAVFRIWPSIFKIFIAHFAGVFICFHKNIIPYCMGSGTTGQACINTGRNFIGIEKDEKYYNIAKERLGL